MGASVATPFQYHSELIDGQEIPKPLPKILHSRLQAYLIRTLGNQLAERPGWEVLSEQNLLCGADRLVPDVTVVGPGAAYVDGDLASPAAIAIEILSSDQEISDLFTKAGKIFKTGTSFVVILWPESQRCWTYSFEEDAQNGHGVKLATERASEFLSHLAARSRALCASNDVTEDTGRSVRAFKAYELEVSLPTMWASLLGPV